MPTLTATETAYNTQPAATADGVNTTASKWFSLQQNVLDGTYKAMPSTGAGWWGTTMSDSSGVLSPVPVLTITGARSVWSIDIVGDSQLGEYPVDFTVELYNGASLLYTHTVIGNTNVSYYAHLSQIYDVTSMVYKFTKINKADRSVKIVEAYSGFVIQRTDTLLVALISTDTTGIVPISNDNLLIGLDEQSQLDNIYTAMDTNQRQVLGRVEITYTDPFNDESIVITASETAQGTSTMQLADSISTSQYKWFSLQNNVLDGSFHPMPGNNEASVGWWGTSLSDNSGNIAAAPTITVQFAARSLTSLKLIGDDKLNCFPVDFTYHAYDASNTLLYTNAIIGNTLLSWYLDITPISNVTKVTVTITKINQANATAKITEMFTAIVETYDNDIIESIHLLEEIGYTTGSLPIGNLSANEVDIVLSNADRRFDLNNSLSTLYGYVKRNRRIRVWLGAYVGPDIEWVIMGTFWTTAWDITSSSLVASLTARDRLELLRLTDFTISTVYINYTLYQLFDLVLSNAGLLSSEYAIDTDLTDITIPYAWFDRISHRDALLRLSGCGIIQVYCQKDGIIRVNLNLDATTDIFHTFDDDVNVYSSKYPLAVAEQVNYVEVSSKQWIIGSSQEVYSSTEVISFAANETIIKTLEFSSTPVTSITSPVIVGTSGITVNTYTLYAWGAVVTLINSNPTPGTITSVTVSGTVLSDSGDRTLISQDASLVKQDGKIKVTLDHDFIQSTSYAQSLADTILATYKASRYDVSLDNRGSAALRLGDRVLVNDAYQGMSIPYMVFRQQIQWDGYLQVTTEGKKL